MQFGTISVMPEHQINRLYDLVLEADFERFQDCGYFIHVVYSPFDDTGVQHGKHKIRIS